VRTLESARSRVCGGSNRSAGDSAEWAVRNYLFRNLTHGGRDVQACLILRFLSRLPSFKTGHFLDSRVLFVLSTEVSSVELLSESSSVSSVLVEHRGIEIIRANRHPTWIQSPWGTLMRLQPEPSRTVRDDDKRDPRVNVHLKGRRRASCRR
jgi:hypothetical protein